MKTQTLKNLFLAVFILLITQPAVVGQNKIIQLNTGEKRYDQLDVQAHNVHVDKDAMIIKGRSENGTQWIFTIPDSIVTETSGFEFGYTKNGDRYEDSRWVGFVGNIGGDTLKGHSVNFDMGKDSIQLSGTFFKTESHESLTRFSNDSVGIGYHHIDLFMVDPESNQYLKEAMQDPYFGYFQNRQKIEKTYEEYLSYYAATIAANSQSVYYISRLDSWKSGYKSTDDVQKLYDLFEPEMQQSYFGKRIDEYIRSKNRFLSATFENMLLPVHGTGKLEPIIQDSSKYNLVIFSASWCGPCIEEIPLLKEVYNDLGNMLSMTYISMDDSKTINAWGELIKEQQIPWRSLLAEKDVKGIRKKYHEEGIPYTVLVYPDSQAIEVLDIRIKENRDKLYSLFGK